MSSNGNIFPPISLQNEEVLANMNSSILSNFLMGMYTTVYLETLYLYTTRKTTQRAVIISAITILYLTGLVQFAVQWFLAEYNAKRTSAGDETSFVALFNFPTWSHIVIDVTTFLMFIVADGLLIWRCYHVWGRSYRVVLLPLFLLLVEVGFSVSSIIFILVILAHSYPDSSQIDIINDLQSTIFFVSFATTLTTTVLVAYRINSSTREMSDITFTASKGRFRHIVEIIVQSAAIYSAVLLLAAISEVVPTTGQFPTLPLFSLSSWSTCFLVPVAGIAPTIMVARVSLASKANDENVVSRSPADGVLSNLRFDRHSERSVYQNETHADLGGMGPNHGVYDSQYDVPKVKTSLN